MIAEKIALVHYTAQPAVGGIENLIALQAKTLLHLGIQVRLVVGSGTVEPGVEIRLIPELLPSHPGLSGSARSLPDAEAVFHHPLTRSLFDALRSALEGCTQCWVHNVFTLDLNPFAAAALWQLAESSATVRFVAWCEDNSVASRFVGPESHRIPLKIPDSIEVVAISSERAKQLRDLLNVNLDRVRVVEPPIDLMRWVDADDSTQQLIRRLQLLNAYPVVFVPSKALAHKGLDKAIELGAALKRALAHPLVLLSAAPSPHQPDLSLALLDGLENAIREQRVTDVVFLCSRQLRETLSHRAMRALLMLSDVMYLPSEEEGYGTPLLEAMALRLPVICTDLPSFRECAGEFAVYCARSAPADDVAREVMRLVSRPANQARRRAVLSYREYSGTLRDVLHSESSGVKAGDPLAKEVSR